MSEITRLEREKRRAENKNNLREIANLSNLLGQELQEVGDFEGALAQHREESGICEALEDTIGVAVAHRRMGEVYSEMGKWDKALHHQHRHLLLAKEAKSLIEEQRAYATIGRTHLQRAEESGIACQEKEQSVALTEAEKAFLRSLSTCERLKGEVDAREYRQMCCRLYLNLGLVVDSRGNSTKARHFIGQALDICSGHNLHEDAQRCHSALSHILLREGLLTSALEEGTKALTVSTKLHNRGLQCECHCFLAQVHLMNADYEAAKKCFYKAYKLKHPDKQERGRIEGNLKTVVKLCIAEDTLISLGDASKNEKLKLYEKLGDGLANLGLYSKALEFYHKIVHESTELGRDPSSLAPIYLSLAQTYVDNKQYNEAKEYYHKEYNIREREDPSEACKTLINILNVSENLGEDYEAVNSIYDKAKILAMKAGNPKLELYVLTHHASATGIPKKAKTEIQKQVDQIVEEHGLDPDAELTDEENNSDDEVDLDLVHFYDSEDEQENFDRPRQPRQKKSFTVKRNEKGETPLHKACIDGNLTMVKKLLHQGHPVNPRDNCGWIPLHEAANHGFYEIVLALIDAGAWISDRGGQYCDGITPMHDAAACGNFDVVRLLMTRGASVIATNKNGETPLESLVQYRMRAKLRREEEEACIKLEQDLESEMKSAGHKVSKLSSKTTKSYPRTQGSHTTNTNESSRRHSSEDKVKEKKRLSSRSLIADEEEDWEEDLPTISVTSSQREDIVSSPVMSSHQSENEAEEDSEDLVNPLLEDLHHETESATGTYLNAIGSVGSAARRAELKKNTESAVVVEKERKEALVSEIDDVGDDWLDDDLGIFSKKRKRMEKLEFDYKELSKRQKSSIERNSQEKFQKIGKVRQTKLTSIVKNCTDNSNERLRINDDLSTGRFRTDMSESESVICNESSLVSTNMSSVSMNTSRSPNTNASPFSVSGSQGSVVGSALRLKVRVQNRVLLVPVAGNSQERTVKWLAEEVSRRYYQLAGLRPHLNLTTQDGAELDPNDPITLVLPTDQTELQTHVTGWDLPPLHVRYTQACEAFGTARIPFLESVLQSAEASTRIDLSSAMRLVTEHLKPVLRAIQYQQCLSQLNLSSCRLGDDGFRCLVDALPSLTGLEVLDLQGADLTTTSLIIFTEAITVKGLTMKFLNILDLSYNTFSEASISHINTIFSLPVLTTLRLKHCYLSLTGQLQMPKVSSTLKVLSLDYNTISSIALACLLSCASKLTNLTLSSLVCKSENSDTSSASVGAALSVVLGAGEECLLQHLDLSFCSLVDSDLEDISAYLYRCPYLVSINLSHNKELTFLSLNNFLDEVANNMALPLSELSLHGNKSLLMNSYVKIASTVKNKFNKNHPITSFSVASGAGDEQLEEMWKSHHRHKAFVRAIGGELFFQCKT